MKKLTVISSQFTISLLVVGLFFLLTTVNREPATVYAASVDLGTQYAFGGSKFQTLGQLFSQFIPALFSVSAIIVFLYFLYGGIRYLIAGPNKEDVAKARAMIINGIIGIIILIFVFLFAQYLPGALGVEGFRIF